MDQTIKQNFNNLRQSSLKIEEESKQQHRSIFESTQSIWETVKVLNERLTIFENQKIKI